MNDFAVRILSAAQGKTHLFAAGQAGYVIKSKSGQLLAWDLYLSECGERMEGHIGFKRLLPKILLPQEISFDWIVASHPHFDHFDMDSVPILMSSPKTKLFASIECRKEAERLFMKHDRTAYVRPGETYSAGDFTLHFINCDHGTGAPDAVGAVITVDGKNFFFAGDTCLRLDRIPEILSFGNIDVMIAPINGAFGNLNEHDCALLSRNVRPVLTVPCHYGMFAAHGGNPRLFMEYMKEECPDNSYLLMCMGEEYEIPEDRK